MNLEIMFEAPTWDETYNMLLDLADKIKNDGIQPDVIAGVCRGGWLPARVLSDLLGVCNLANVGVEFYLAVGKTRRKPKLTQSVSLSISGNKVLIVDEVVDTGKSLELVKKHIINRKASEVKTATIYYKPWSKIKPDYYVKETTNWIIFPWEIKETTRVILKKCREQKTPIEKEITKLVKSGVSQVLVQRFLKEISEEDNC